MWKEGKDSGSVQQPLRLLSPQEEEEEEEIAWRSPLEGEG